MEQQMIFSVSEANNFIKALLDRVPQLQEIFVRGEISNYKLYPSGHHYFTLKDAEGAMRCVLFKGNALRLRFRPENGMKVIAFGRISVFPRDGAYQLYVSELSPEGAGDPARSPSSSSRRSWSARGFSIPRIRSRCRGTRRPSPSSPRPPARRCMICSASSAPAGR